MRYFAFGLGRGATAGVLAQQHCKERLKRMASGQRLGSSYTHHGSVEVAGLQRRHKRRLVYDVAPEQADIAATGDQCSDKVDIKKV